MNIFIEKSESVDIEGLTEAAVASSDIQLKIILDYLKDASRHLPNGIWTESFEHQVLGQVREACLGELCRRHGDDYSYPPYTGLVHPDVLKCSIAGVSYWL